MKVVICSAGYSGYSSACWRELACRTNVTVSVYTPLTAYPYSDTLLSGLPVHVLSPSEMSNRSMFGKTIAAEKPDVIVLPGWAYKTFNSLCVHPELKYAKKILAIDTAWTGNWRQILSRLTLSRIVKRLDAIMVAGERGRLFARYLGFPPRKIYTSTYGFDYQGFCVASNIREHGWRYPRSFVYVGRFVPIKGLDVLADAYHEYNRCVQDPWPLHCYGHGDYMGKIEGIEGLTAHDFVEPSQLPTILAQHGVYLLPSVHEPWGVSLVEAASTGMPVICSDAVASGVDVVRHLYNGLVIPAKNSRRLLNALVWCHQHHDQLEVMGGKAQVFAEAYSARHWADRWIWMCEELLNDSGR